MMKRECTGKVAHWERNVKERITLRKGELDCAISRGKGTTKKERLNIKERTKND